VLIRLGEIYLMRAEAKLRSGDNAGALADVNTLRTSRNARPAQTPAALTSINLDVLFRETGLNFTGRVSEEIIKSDLVNTKAVGPVKQVVM
jgi:hypothetical protein